LGTGATLVKGYDRWESRCCTLLYWARAAIYLIN
jgi:hypothetical protein